MHRNTATARIEFSRMYNIARLPRTHSTGYIRIYGGSLMHGASSALHNKKVRDRFRWQRGGDAREAREWTFSQGSITVSQIYFLACGKI